MLCSDGLFNHVTDEELAQMAIVHEPGLAVSGLIDLANQRGGSDNISIVLARFTGIPATT